MKTLNCKENWIDVNLNDYIKVKLTDYGLKIYQESFTRLGLQLPRINCDEEGYVRFQIHTFMHDFGKVLFCGGEMPCLPNVQIQISDKVADND